MEPLAQPCLRTLELAHAEVAVREWGDKGAKPLVYWHALNPFGALEAAEVGPRWADAGFYVVAPAGPGCGESPQLPSDVYRPSRLALLAADILDAIGVARADFVGASWGAAIGIALTANAPARVRRLVLLDGGYADVADDPTFADKSLPEITQMFAAQHGAFAFSGEETFVAAMRERYRRWSPALEQRLLAGMRNRGGELVPASSPEAAAAAMFGLKEEPIAGHLARVAGAGVPVFLLVPAASAADEAAASALERFRVALPDARVDIVDGVGHDLVADAPEEIGDLVAEWLLEERCLSACGDLG